MKTFTYNKETKEYKFRLSEFLSEEELKFLLFLYNKEHNSVTNKEIDSEFGSINERINLQIDLDDCGLTDTVYPQKGGIEYKLTSQGKSLCKVIFGKKK